MKQLVLVLLFLSLVSAQTSETPANSTLANETLSNATSNATNSTGDPLQEFVIPNVTEIYNSTSWYYDWASP